MDLKSALEVYGTYCFLGKTAKKYLKAQGLPESTLDTPEWTEKCPDEVAQALLAWAREKGAHLATHWFQPLGSGGLRAGMSGQVHNAMFSFDSSGQLKWEFSGSELLKGETDGSSYQNGGMRATHTAGGYTVLDPSSPIFIRGDTMFIPTAFASFYGDALDEKTPLLRAMQAVSREGCRFLKHLGYTAGWVKPMIGLEQEFFLIPRAAYYKRPDLQSAGRTVMGAAASRGQEMCDHYMAPLNQVALACMKEIQHECFLMGIPMKTRHREVAPNQYEVAPYFGIASAQIDQNILAMQIMEEVAARHGLAAILHEKPFKGVNGSGKHNNFSLGTDTKLNLYNAGQVTKECGNSVAFATIMSATVRAVDKYGDLMRMAIASPGNDFRLGACEAPPAIISTYLGESLTSYLEDFKNGNTSCAYEPKSKVVDLGIDEIDKFTVPAEDRNRTSPFPYGGHRFEFRAVGSSQNVSMVNTVLCSILAESFAFFSDQIEAGVAPEKVASDALNEHWKVIFNGNGYSAEWPIEADKLGVTRCDSGVEAVEALGTDKSVALFESMKVLSAKEVKARVAVMHDQYSGTVEIESNCMVEMIKEHVLPAAKKNMDEVGDLCEKLRAGLAKLEAKIAEMHKEEDSLAKARCARVLRLEVMEEVREICDAIEVAVPKSDWTIASYRELLFLDSNQADKIV